MGTGLTRNFFVLLENRPQKIWMVGRGELYPVLLWIFGFVLTFQNMTYRLFSYLCVSIGDKGVPGLSLTTQGQRHAVL